MSWKAEVIADNSGKWVGNGLVFETELEAKLYASNLANRWMAVRQTRVVSSDAKVTARWSMDGGVTTPEEG